MDQRIAVAFRRRCENERSPFVLRQTERVVCSERADLQSRDRQFQIIDWTRRRREVKNVINFVFGQKNEVRNVVLDEAKIRIAGEMTNVGRIAGDEIVDRDDAMPLAQESVNQM